MSEKDRTELAKLVAYEVSTVRGKKKGEIQAGPDVASYPAKRSQTPAGEWAHADSRWV